MKEVRGCDGVEGVVAKGKLPRVADDFVNGAIALVEEMIDLEIESDAKAGRVLQQIGIARADVENRPRISAVPQQAEIDGDSAAVAIESPQIAQRALHVGDRRVVLDEQLRLADATSSDHRRSRRLTR